MVSIRVWKFDIGSFEKEYKIPSRAINREFYSVGVHVFIGKFFVACDDIEKSIEQFKKALPIKEEPDTTEKLNELLK